MNSSKPTTSAAPTTTAGPSPGGDAKGAVLHGFSVDVEDWFHILDCQGAPDPRSWAGQPARVEANTAKILDVLDAHRVRASFYCLGWIADQHPQVIAEIARRGHEIGSHGHLHGLLGHLGRDAFARDLDLSLEALAKAGGGTVKTFRAPGFSLTAAEVPWALPILADRGIDLDASLFLTDRAHGGLRLDRQRPFDLLLADGRKIREVPVVPRRIAGREIAYSGGGYLRLFPWPVLRDSFARAQAQGQPVVAYLHPREVDPDQPRMKLPPLRRFKYYVGLNTVLRKMDLLFSHFRFGTLRQVAEQGLLDPPATLQELTGAGQTT